MKKPTDSAVSRRRLSRRSETRRHSCLYCAQLALTWVLRHPQVTSALIGASSVAQLEQNVAAVHAAPLTPDEIAAIEPFAVDGTGRR